MLPKLRGQFWRGLFKLILMFVLIEYCCSRNLYLVECKRQARQQTFSTSDDQDPMEPCYLANNRASESLTISESTPVGTVVGEIMVNGDSSTNGNIELSIRMPGGNPDSLPSSSSAASSPVSSGRLPTTSGGASTQRQKQATGNHYSNPSMQNLTPTSYTITQPSLPAAESSAKPDVGGAKINTNSTVSNQSESSSSTPIAASRDLTQIIDLMPPLTIEQGTKRLILAKRLDRENLDKYIALGGYQTSGSSQQSSSSASLTVHVNCQLRSYTSANNISLNGNQISGTKTKSSLANTIVIPIHIIVTDENDNWPVFINTPYMMELSETVPLGSLLTGNEIQAVDRDQQGPFSTIEYSIVPGSLWSDSFSFLNPLDSSSLVVKDNRFLDFESQSKLAFKIMARDQGDPSNWAITSLIINLHDSDDLNPVFNDDKYNGFIRENRPGEVVDMFPKRLLAHDGDKMINSPILFSFHIKTNQSIHFDLDPDLAVLTLRKTLPDDLVANKQQPFCLLIRATQVDNPRRSSISMVNIRMSKAPLDESSLSATNQLEQLLTIGDKSQQFDPFALHHQQSTSSSITSPGSFKFAHSNYTVEVSEAATEGFTIMNLRASFSNNRDKPLDGVTYQLLDDTLLGHFAIDETTGRLTLNKSLDYEMYRQLSFRVLATFEYQDGKSAGRLLCDITRINVIVVNQNEFAPEFSHDQYNFQLSISDLIVNFEPQKLMYSSANQIDGNELKRLAGGETMDPRTFLRRSGDGLVEIPLDGSDDFQRYEPFDDSKAMQLGQVYCADRDFGERVSLQLTGSKANLFRLTQDGRLLLPLVNVSTHSEDHFDRKLDQNGQDIQTKTINNQLIQSKFFASRRNDQFSEVLDRKYLNYLLGELSNVGRLRLKVNVKDNGKSHVRQSTSLIVVSVISVENFILQKGVQFGSPITNKVQPIGNEASDEFHSDSDKNINQMMMIQSMNGKDLVPINPDIIDNLFLSNGANDTKSASANSSSLAGKSSGQESLQASASDLVNSRSSIPTNGNKQPSLLLVDDVGVKFVAMPDAIELYHRQFQEAADHQAKRSRSSELPQINSMGFAVKESENSIWNRVKSRLSYKQPDIGDSNTSESSRSIGNVLIWILFSVAGLNVLAIFAYMIYKNSRSNPTCWPSSSAFTQSNSRFMPNFFGTNKSGNLHKSAVDILSQSASRYVGSDNSMISSGDSSTDNSNSYAFVRHNRSLNYRTRQRSEPKSPSRVGMVTANVENPISSGSRCVDESTKQQQNLLGHLRVTLNKMLDIQEPTGSGSVNHLMSQEGGGGSNSYVQDYGNPSMVATNSPIQCVSTSSPINSSTTNNDSSSPSPRAIENGKTNTFVSFVSPQQAKPIASSHTNSSNNKSDENTNSATVISICVTQAKRPNESEQVYSIPEDASSAIAINKSATNSFNSSVVSLASSSSSISQKINASIGKKPTKGQEQITGSDSSSVDSAFMFKTGSDSSRSPTTSHQLNSIGSSTSGSNPPVPPPQPPPLASMGGLKSASFVAKTKPFSSLHQEDSTMLPQNKRRPLPQNPTHIKLRQQAKNQQAIGNSIEDQRSLKQSQYKCDKSLTYNGVLVSKSSPPIPPPLPPLASELVVSSADSVDRGYESSPSQALGPNISFPNIPPPPSALETLNYAKSESSCGQQPITGRQIQRNYHHQSLRSSHQQPHQQQQQPFRKQHQQSIKSFGSVAQRSNLNQGRKSARLPAQTSGRGQQTQPVLGDDCRASTSEDGEFYYCYDNRSDFNAGQLYDQPNDLINDYVVHAYNPDRNHARVSEQSPDFNMLRKLQQSIQVEPTDLIPSINHTTSSHSLQMRQSQQTSNHVNDLRSQSNHNNRIQKHSHNQSNRVRQPTNSNQYQANNDGTRSSRRRVMNSNNRYQNNISYDMNSQAANCRKHLTWSDQVGIAQ